MKSMLPLAAGTVFTVALWLFPAHPTLAQDQREEEKHDGDALGRQFGQVTVYPELRHDLSAPLRELSAATQEPFQDHPRKKHHSEGELPLPPGTALPHPDPVLQTSTGPLVGTSALLNFEGLGMGFPGFTITGAPSDTNGAVGASQYVQWVNTSFAVFNKATGALIAGPTAGNALWSGFGGGCQTNNNGDPIAQYDKAANRWVMTQFSISTTPRLQCIAVSTTSDATGTYNRYAFSFGNNCNDYGKMGVWPDAYYFTFNIFNGSCSGSFLGGQACAADRARMLAGLTATMQCLTSPNLSLGGALPSDLDGSTAPPVGSPNFFLNMGTSTSLQLWKFHVDFTTPANTTFTGPTALTVGAYSIPCPSAGGSSCVPQPGTSTQLDTLADRMMYRLAYRNFGSHESLAVAHTIVGPASNTGIRWYEIISPNATPTVLQQSTFAPDSDWRFMPSIAMDKVGNMAVGYSVSSSATKPAIRYTGRVNSELFGVMESETSIIAGSGSQTGGLNRWGDYSAMTIDPSDDCTFFYTTEYLTANGSFNWHTRVGTFKFPNCQ